MSTPKPEVVSPGNDFKKWADGATCCDCSSECKIGFNNLIIKSDELFKAKSYQNMYQLYYNCGFCGEEQKMSVPHYVYLATKKNAEYIYARNCSITALILCGTLTIIGCLVHINYNIFSMVSCWTIICFVVIMISFLLGVQYGPH